MNYNIRGENIEVTAALRIMSRRRSANWSVILTIA